MRKRYSINNEIISIRTGRLAGDAAWGLVIALVFGSVVGYPYSLFLLLPASYIAFTVYGIKLDGKNKRLKHFYWHFGFLETGRWEENKFVDMSILGSRVVYGGLHGGFKFGLFRNFTKANKVALVLLDKYHVKRLELCETDTVEEAIEMADCISKETNLPVVDFNPVKISPHRKK